MARIRQIKPRFFVDEDIATLGLAARLMFIGLWTLADRSGRLEDKPLTIKLQTLPMDDVDANLILAELAARSLIYRYQVDGKRYISIPGFTKHQHFHHAEPESTLPAPETGIPANRQEPSKTPTIAATLQKPGASPGQPPDKPDAKPSGIRDRELGIGDQGSGKNQAGKPPAPGAENPFTGLVAIWQRLWLEIRGARYDVTGPDRANFGRLLKTLPRDSLDELPELFERYISDDDPFVAKQGWSLSYFCTSGGVNKYRANGVPIAVLPERSRQTISAATRFLERGAK